MFFNRVFGSLVKNKCKDEKEQNLLNLRKHFISIFKGDIQ